MYRHVDGNHNWYSTLPRVNCLASVSQLLRPGWVEKILYPTKPLASITSFREVDAYDLEAPRPNTETCRDRPSARLKGFQVLSLRPNRTPE
jgi:hypothetical protein